MPSRIGSSSVAQIRSACWWRSTAEGSQARVPGARPLALLDTLRLARHRRPDLKKGHSLGAWIERLNLAEVITSAAVLDRPRAR